MLKAAGSTVVVAESFSAFGARRGSNWSGAPSSADLTVIAATTAEGFTGHDMLDGVGLIHMHGRVYDPTMGRFLSVDPVVRDTAASQSWNGYGYVEGRMLSATDPDGFTTDVNCPSCNKPVEPALERVIVEATRRMAEVLRSAEVAYRLDLGALTRPSLGGVTMNEGLETVVVTATAIRGGGGGGAGGGGTDGGGTQQNDEPKYKICRGQALVYAGNPTHVGRTGGMLRPIRPGAAAIIPRQWTGTRTAGPMLRSQGALVGGVTGGGQQLSGLDDTAGNTDLGPDPQGVLLARANGALYIELITGRHEGATTVALAIPIYSPLGCPAGTSQTGTR